MQNSDNLKTYGKGDNSFQIAGGEKGIKALVDDFYDVMLSRPEAKTIREMHPEDLTVSRDKLYRFLCAWLGGPKLFSEKYGAISIPQAHSHLAIGEAERDAWLACMEQALKKHVYPDEFKAYLLKALAVPAERCRTQ